MEATSNRRVIEPATGRKGSWVSLDGLNRRHVLVKWDDGGVVEEVAIRHLLELTQTGLDRFLGNGGRIAGQPSDAWLDLKDVDEEAARCEAAVGNPVHSS